MAVCKKISKIFICLILASSMAFLGFARLIVLAVNPDGAINLVPSKTLENQLANVQSGASFGGTSLYISEIMVGTGKTPEEAKAAT